MQLNNGYRPVFLLGQRKKINPLNLRRMCVGFQGAPNESVLEYVPFGATPKTGAKTSKAGELFFSAGLKPLDTLFLGFFENQKVTQLLKSSSD
jgi:hypothetical protein